MILVKDIHNFRRDKSSVEPQVLDGTEDLRLMSKPARLNTPTELFFSLQQGVTVPSVHSSYGSRDQAGGFTQVDQVSLPIPSRMARRRLLQRV